MRRAVLLLAVLCMTTACGSTSKPPAPTVPAAAASPSSLSLPSPSPAAAPPNPEVGICKRLNTLLPGMLSAANHRHAKAVRRYASVFARWSRTVTAGTNDATFANYLADAGVDLSLLTSPTGSVYRAGVGLGHVVGYCKFTVGVTMRY